MSSILIFIISFIINFSIGELVFRVIIRLKGGSDKIRWYYFILAFLITFPIASLVSAGFISLVYIWFFK